jgi:hypothetical protein
MSKLFISGKYIFLLMISDKEGNKIPYCLYDNSHGNINFYLEQEL